MSDPCTRCGRTDGTHAWNDSDCVLPHRQHSRATIGHVCARCVDRHRDWLREIVELYGTLAQVVLAGSVDNRSDEYQKPRKRIGSPSPLRLDAWAMLTGQLNDHVKGEDGVMRAAYLGANLPDVPAVLSGWAQVAFDAQNWTSTAPDTVTGAAAALTAALEVMAHQPEVDEYDAELKWLRRALRSAHGLTEKGKRPVGKCPSLDGWGKPCDGPLWPDRHGKMEVTCGRCARRFDEPFLRHLGGMLDTASGQ